MAQRFKNFTDTMEQLARKSANANTQPSGGSHKAIQTPTPDGHADFGIVDDTVGNDVATKWAPITVDGQPYRGFLTVRTAPATDAVLDCKNSDDNGASWTTIFPSGNQNKILIPAGFVGKRIYRNFAPVKLKEKTGILRLDSLVSGGAKDILFVVVYGASGKAGAGGQLAGTQPGGFIATVTASWVDG
jgi:hypothetical protein